VSYDFNFGYDLYVLVQDWKRIRRLDGRIFDKDELLVRENPIKTSKLFGSVLESGVPSSVIPAFVGCAARGSSFVGVIEANFTRRFRPNRALKVPKLLRGRTQNIGGS
jgi:hypothetical protein